MEWASRWIQCPVRELHCQRLVATALGFGIGMLCLEWVERLSDPTGLAVWTLSATLMLLGVGVCLGIGLGWVRTSTEEGDSREKADREAHCCTPSRDGFVGSVPAYLTNGALALVLGLCPVPRTMAQVPSALGDRSVHFQRLEGLSHNTVYALHQDRQGFLWIGTADGLNRYDGYELVVYRHLPSDSNSLVDNTVQALAEDPSGDLWVGTAGGLDCLDRTTGRFEHYDLTPERSDVSHSIAQVVVDGAGRVWVTTYLDPRLYRYDRKDHEFKRYRIGGTIDVRSLDVGPAGRLWFTAEPEGGAERILYRYDGRQDQFHSVMPLRNGWLLTGHSGIVWVGGDLPGTPAPNGVSLRRIEAPNPPEEVRTATHGARSGLLWIGTNRGVLRYNPITGALQRHAVDTSGTSGLSNYVWDLVEDRAGILWVGTRSGLYRYDPHRKPFAHLGPSDGVLTESGQGAVMALHEEALGTLWVGTLGGGLVRLRGLEGPSSLSEVRYALPSDQVWALHEDQQGRHWVGTAAGLCRLNRTTRRCAPPPQWGRGSTDPGPVYTFAEGPDGSLWLGGTKLYRLNPGTGQVDTPLPLEYGRDYTTIQALHFDGARRLWIGMEGGGLARYRLETGHLDLDWGTALLRETVWTIHERTDGLLWLGTDLGLVRLDPATDSTAHFFDSDRLPGSIVYSILEDGQGRLWMGTNQGLARFDPRTEQFRRFDASNGVRNVEFNRRAAVQGADGRFFFGGLRGITAFDPEAIRENPYVPPVAITQMTKVNQSGTVSIDPYGREHVVLDYRDRVFTFEYAALNFTNPTKNRYAYQLDGFEEDWVEAGTRRVVRYTNVPPGEYVFRVRGANNDGVWNEEGTTMRVTITPPFWQTWWFRVLVGALVVGALVLAYRIRVRHLLRVERLRLRIASDLHDDIGSKLSSIVLMSEMIRDEASLAASQRGELSQISRIARRMGENLRDIVWFIDPDHDRAGALVLKMKRVAGTLLNGMEYTFECPDHFSFEGTDMRFRRNVFLIYKEALHNVVQHAQAQTVDITLDDEPGALVLRITDDGVGFDLSDPGNSGNGLKNMARRAEQIGADLEVMSRPGGGTEIRLVAKNNAFT